MYRSLGARDSAHRVNPERSFDHISADTNRLSVQVYLSLEPHDSAQSVISLDDANIEMGWHHMCLLCTTGFPLSTDRLNLNMQMGCIYSVDLTTRSAIVLCGM